MKPLALGFSSSRLPPPRLPHAPHHLPQLGWVTPSPAQAPLEKSRDFLGLGAGGQMCLSRALPWHWETRRGDLRAGVPWAAPRARWQGKGCP